MAIPRQPHWGYYMTIKEKMLKAVEELPDDASIEDAMEKLLVLANIERGLAQDNRGETFTHQEVKDKMTDPLRQHPVLKKVVLQEDPAQPLTEEDWPPDTS